MKQLIVFLFAVLLAVCQGQAVGISNLVTVKNPENLNFSSNVGQNSTLTAEFEFPDNEITPTPGDQPVVMSNGVSLDNNDYVLFIEGVDSKQFFARVISKNLFSNACTVSVTYAPTAAGAHQATLKVQCNAVGSPVITVNLSGNASIDPFGRQTNGNNLKDQWNGVEQTDRIILPNSFDPVNGATPMGEGAGVVIPIIDEILDIIKELIKDPPYVAWDIDSEGFDTFFSTTRTVGETYSKKFEIWGSNTRYHHEIFIELEDPNGVFSINNKQRTIEGNHYLWIDGEDIDTKIERSPERITLTYKPNSSGSHQATLKVSASCLGFYIDRSYTFTCNAVERSIVTSESFLTLRSSVGNTVSKKIKVTGSGLTGPLTVKLSDSSNKFSIDKNSITAAQAVAGDWITVSYSPKDACYQIADFAEIIISGGGASSKTVHLTGLTPYLGLNPGSHDFGSTLIGESKSQKIVISGLNLNGPLSVQLKDETGMFSVDPSVISLPNTENMNEIGRTVTVTYNPTASGSHSASVTVVGGGAESNTVYFTGTCLERYITVNTSSLDCGTVAKGKTSTKTFTVQGLNLTGSLSVKSNNTKFTVSPATITKDNAANTVTVTVTYKPTGAGSDSGTITVSGGGAASQTVSVCGKCVVPSITVNPTTLSFGDILKGNSSTKTFLVTGTDLTGSLTVTSSNSNFTVSPTTISKANAANGVYVNVTYNPSTRGSHSGTITVSGGDAEGKTVSVSGKCVQPSITVTPTSLSFGDVVKGNTSSKTFTVTGVDLTGSLSVTSSNSKFTVSTASITAANAANGVTVTVTYKPTARGDDSGTITISGGGASSKTVSVTGKCIYPEITVTPNSLDFGGVVWKTSVKKTFKVTGTELTGNLSLSLTMTEDHGGFDISPRTITAAEAAVGKTVTVTCSAINAGDFSGTVTISGGGASKKTVSLSATGVVPVINVTPSSLNFGFKGKNSTTTGTCKVFGSNLTGALTLAISGDDEMFSIDKTSVSDGGSFIVTYRPTAPGDHYATITVSGGGAISKTIKLIGTCVEPYITTDVNSLNFDASDVKSFKVIGTALFGNLTLTVTGSGKQYFNLRTTSISASDAASGVWVVVDCNPTNSIQHTGAIVTISGGGAEPKTVHLSYAKNQPIMIGSVLPGDEDGEIEGEGTGCVTLSALGNSTSDLGELIQEAKIYAEGQNIVIESPAEQSAVICDVAGRARTVNLQVGRNVIPVNASGLFIVRVREKTAKLMLR